MVRYVVSKNIVICDIDGTISKPGERLKYLKQEPKDWDSFYSDCFDDEPIREIIDLVSCLFQDYKVVFCTGRRECCREKTVRWLSKFGLVLLSRTCLNSGKTLLMRKDGDLRPDVIVKPELIREAGIDFSDIAFIIEDRNCMVAEWRRLGLICIQPFEGDF
jgi:hypothetical protein